MHFLDCSAKHCSLLKPFTLRTEQHPMDTCTSTRLIFVLDPVLERLWKTFEAWASCLSGGLCG